MKSIDLKYVFVLLSISIFLFSCDEVIDIDTPEHTPRLVVVSGFQPDEPWEVEVSVSRSSLNPELFYSLEDVEVRVRSLDGSFSEELVYQDEWFKYISQGTPEQGLRYEIEVSAKDLSTVYSENHIPQAATIISIDTLEGFHDGEITTDYELTFSNPENEEGFYIVQLFSNNDYWWKDQIGNIMIIQSDDPNVDQITSDDYGAEMLFIRDQNFDGQEYTLRFYTPNYYYYSENGQSPGYTVKLFSCSEDFYRFQKTLLQYNDTEGNPFAQPTQIHSNIENGIGVFGGFVVSEVEL